MDPARIAELLRPFSSRGEFGGSLAEALAQYLDLLLRWNARVNVHSQDVGNFGSAMTITGGIGYQFASF